MTGNLSRAVLRGADARESACLPDLTLSKHLKYVKIYNIGFNFTFQGGDTYGWNRKNP